MFEVIAQLLAHSVIRGPLESQEEPQNVRDGKSIIKGINRPLRMSQDLKARQMNRERPFPVRPSGEHLKKSLQHHSTIACVIYTLYIGHFLLWASKA